VQTGMAVIEHDFGNGLTVRNGSIYADYTAAIATSIRAAQAHRPRPAAAR